MLHAVLHVIKYMHVGKVLGEGNVKFTYRWLLNQLILYLSPYMS